MTRFSGAGAVTEHLVGWASGLLPQIPATAISSTQPVVPDGIAIQLIGVSPRTVPAVAGVRSSALALDYRIHARLADPLAEHQALSDLAFAAVENEAFEFIMADSAGLVLRAEVRRDAMLPTAPLVRHPPIANLTPLAQAQGQVLGPEGQPIANAVVTMAGTNRSATTGRDGRFSFAIPAGTPAKITARARSREVSASLDPDTTTILTLPMEA
jgi:Carboxypeptidase regulatory-like domain